MIPIHVHGPQKDSPYVYSPLKCPPLCHQRQPQKWTTTLKMEEDLKNGRRPQKWKMTSKMEDDLKNRRWPQIWKTTSKMEDNLENGR